MSVQDSRDFILLARSYGHHETTHLIKGSTLSSVLILMSSSHQENSTVSVSWLLAIVGIMNDDILCGCLDGEAATAESAEEYRTVCHCD
jgi:predicted membrane channel-forming protein YqfA (hemolysin III family)